MSGDMDSHATSSHGAKPPNDIQEATYQSMGSQRLEPTHNDTTVFGVDRSAIDYQPANLSSYRRDNIRSMVSIHEQNDIKAFLEKPLYVKTISLSTGAAAGSTAGSVAFPMDGTYADSSSWKNKLTGFLGFRGTVEFILRINATRYTQGLLLCHYIPGKMSTPEVYAHNFDRTTRSQQPNVIFNLNKDTEVRFSAPYVSPTDFCLTESLSSYPWGTLYITYYAPYKDPSNANVNLDVFVSMKDVELAIPTIQTVQMANKTDLELKPSRLALGAARIVDGFRAVPSLSSIAGTASWALRATSKAFAAFGYSKARMEDEPMSVNVMNDRYLLNSDGPTTAASFAFSKDNKLDVLPGFAGFEEDEMSIEFITSRSSYFTSVQWTPGQAAGYNLGSWAFCPSSFETTSTQNGRTWRSMTPISFISKYFGLWRGNLTLTIRLAKTEFHTGLLALTFRPTISGGSSAAMTFNEGSYCFRTILDITTKDTFVIELPYMNIGSWTPCNNSIGTIFLDVLNPLQCPATVVEPSVTIVAEIAGSKSLEFAGPRNTVMVPIMNSTFTPASLTENEEEYIDPDFIPSVIEDIYDFDSIEGQTQMESSRTGEVDTRTYTGTLGGAFEEKESIQHNRFCVGEKIMSIKQLMSRATKPLCGSNTGTIVASLASTKSLKFTPTLNGGSYYDATLGGWRDHPLSGDFYSAFSSCYVLKRGGVNLHIRNPSYGRPLEVSFATRFDKTTLERWKPTIITSSDGSNGCDQTFTASTICANDVTTCYMPVHIPQYSMSHSRYSSIDFNIQTSASLGNTLPAYTPDQTASQTEVTMAVPSGAVGSSSFQFFRSAADDYQLGFFIGVPVMFAYSESFQNYSTTTA